MKKIWLVMLVALLVVSGGIVYAQNGQWSALDDVELTDEQKAELEDIREQISDLQGQFTSKLAEFGLISPERAAWLQEGRELAREEGCPFGGRARMGFRGAENSPRMSRMRFNR